MNKTPQHIAIIMDGNGRWAKKRLMPRTVGHVRGAANVRNIVKACHEMGVRYLTLFAFSSENWRRPSEEVSALMGLFKQYLEEEIAELKAAGIRLRLIGDRSAFAPVLQASMDRAEQDTALNNRFHLTIAANYGGKWDLLHAMREWQMAHPDKTLQDMDANALASHLSTAELPDPELLIRTGGESRISNFLLWQTAYTELYFTDVHWPDFDAEALKKAIQSYALRVRRFGRTDEQVKDQLISQSQI
ncbi:MAG: di-trans,poly-cis-decaprenylcistransferase [Betaproteobacteria bacterium]|nr:di-trans,poly-cis-decaprenylcistransferase [Betaproteobacteria bacterium]